MTADVDGWVRDGHRITVSFESDYTVLDVVCPVVTPNADDPCRVEWHSDGTPMQDAPPLNFCNVRAWWEGALPEYRDRPDGKAAPFIPAAGSFEVEWRWSGADDCYLWRPVDVPPLDSNGMVDAEVTCSRPGCGATIRGRMAYPAPVAP